MKRSTMIELVIYEALSWDGLEIMCHGIPLEEIVSDILDSCERHGMLPPAYIKGIEDKDLYHTKHPEIAAKTVNEWEPE